MFLEVTTEEKSESVVGDAVEDKKVIEDALPEPIPEEKKVVPDDDDVESDLWA